MCACVRWRTDFKYVNILQTIKRSQSPHLPMWSAPCEVTRDALMKISRAGILRAWAARLGSAVSTSFAIYENCFPSPPRALEAASSPDSPAFSAARRRHARSHTHTPAFRRRLRSKRYARSEGNSSLEPFECFLHCVISMGMTCVWTPPLFLLLLLP